MNDKNIDALLKLIDSLIKIVDKNVNNINILSQEIVELKDKK